MMTGDLGKKPNFFTKRVEQKSAITLFFAGNIFWNTHKLVVCKNKKLSMKNECL